MPTVEAPLEFVEALADLRFPQKTDSLLQDLMDRHTEGRLDESEREELAALVELSERLAILRAQACVCSDAGWFEHSWVLYLPLAGCAHEMVSPSVGVLFAGCLRAPTSLLCLRRANPFSRRNPYGGDDDSYSDLTFVLSCIALEPWGLSLVCRCRGCTGF